MAIEDRSPGWRWAQSWYLLLTLPFGSLSWLAFFYMAVRARRIGWAVWGFLYLAALVRTLTAPQETGPDGQPTLTEAATVALLLLWIVSMVHAFVARNAFLSALDARQGGTPAHAAADPYAAVRAADITPAPARAGDDFAVFHRPSPAPAFTAPPPPSAQPGAVPPPPRAFAQPGAVPPPLPEQAPRTGAVPPPLPEQAPRTGAVPPPPPQQAPHAGAVPPPLPQGPSAAPPPPPGATPPPARPRKPGRQVDY